MAPARFPGGAGCSNSSIWRPYVEIPIHLEMVRPPPQSSRSKRAEETSKKEEAPHGDRKISWMERM